VGVGLEGARDHHGEDGEDVDGSEDLIHVGGLLDADGEEKAENCDDAEGEEVGVMGHVGHSHRKGCVQIRRYLFVGQTVDVPGYATGHAGCSWNQIIFEGIALAIDSELRDKKMFTDKEVVQHGVEFLHMGRLG